MRYALPVVASVAVLAVSPLSRPAGATEALWGAANKHFRTRLLSDKSAYAIDEPIEITLQVRNESNTVQDVFPPDLVREHSLVVRREGEPVRYIAGTFQTSVGATKLKPGEIGGEVEPRLNEYWDFRQPGRYTIQFPETGMVETFVGPFTEEDIRALSHAFPASNVLEIEVKAPPDGKLPPLDLTSRVQLFTQPAGFEVEPWRGVGTNVSWPEVRGWPESLAAVFAFARSGRPWPVYAEEGVVVALRLPFARATDELTTQRAELDGRTLRLQVGLREVGGSSPRVLPYAVLNLDRRLPPGDYTCDVRLVAERKGAAEAEVDGFRFELTVLPGRAGE